MRIGLGLQGGGSHGAFTWGVLDRMLGEVEAGRLEIAAVSGASAGGINAVVLACGLIEGGPALARTRLAELWQGVAQTGAMSGNSLIYGEPGPFGLNLDWNPAAIAVEALGLVVSPYTNPFYRDALAPLLRELLPEERLARLNAETSLRVFVTAVNVASGQRENFTQPALSIDTIRASCCLPGEFKAVPIGAADFWDGGYLGNPALDPLVDVADDLFVILANPLERPAGTVPRSARAILDRLNEITFNASVVLEMNGITAVNRLLEELREQGVDYRGRYRPITLHLIRDDAFLAELGSVSKSSTSPVLLSRLHDAGFAAAERFFAGRPGRDDTEQVEREVIKPMLSKTGEGVSE